MAVDFEKQRLGYTVAVGPYGIKAEDVLSLYFVEDIFSLSVVGRLRFNDKLGIIERRESFNNLDNVTIKYGSLTEAKDAPYEWANANELSFFIQSVTAAESSREDGTKAYDIVFADSSYFLLNDFNFSYSWANPSAEGNEPPYTITDIVSSLVVTMCGLPYSYDFEESQVKLPNYYSPYWTAKQNIQYLTPRNKSVPPTDTSGYVAFTNIVNKNFKFNFVTLEKLLSQDPSGVKIDFYPYKKEGDKVMDYQMLSYDNMGHWYLNGTTYYGYDFTLGKLPFKLVFTYDQALAKTTILGQYSLFGGYSTEHGAEQLTTDMGMPVVWTLETDQSLIENMWYDDWIKRYVQQQMLEVVLLGDPDRQVGSLVEMVFPSKFPEEFSGESLMPAGTPLREGYKWDPILAELSKKWSGYALVKSITHYFMSDTPGYIQKMTLIKNGYEYPDNPVTAPAVKMKVKGGK